MLEKPSLLCYDYSRTSFLKLSPAGISLFQGGFPEAEDVQNTAALDFGGSS